ncbi:hypothetical protein IFM46972_10937 [Aspergillus udagawae]|uniref:Uncharacterized protein n=1 Tax=Aspergillus udagawae TaxID=91492 RepID=A0A8H3XRA0_9EURO|nr:hypothetical protein IFM46972_10937 [Aspergillus udagawae]
MAFETKNTAPIEHSPENVDLRHPSLSWTTSAHSFVHWVLALLAFVISVYGLNVIAWANDLYSSCWIWVEIDSQLLNALFCVMGFGLAPWRIRDLYLWCHWRLGRRAGRQEKWFNHLTEVQAN